MHAVHGYIVSIQTCTRVHDYVLKKFLRQDLKCLQKYKLGITTCVPKFCFVLVWNSLLVVRLAIWLLTQSAHCLYVVGSTVYIDLEH